MIYLRALLQSLIPGSCGTTIANQFEPSTTRQVISELSFTASAVSMRVNIDQATNISAVSRIQSAPNKCYWLCETATSQAASLVSSEYRMVDLGYAAVSSPKRQPLVYFIPQRLCSGQFVERFHAMIDLEYLVSIHS